MTPQEQRAFDAYEYDIRIEGFIDMSVEAAMAATAVRLPEHLAEGLIEDLATTRRHLSVVPLMDFLEQEGDDEEEILLSLSDMASARRDLMGVCLKVATPVRRKEGGYSWGHYTTDWIFAPTYEEAWSLAVEWAKEKA